MIPYPLRHLDRGIAAAWRAGGDGHDQELSAVLALLDSHDDNDRAVLYALVASLFGFAMPEIDIGEDVSRPGDRP
jgi:hypothetical protein